MRLRRLLALALILCAGCRGIEPAARVSLCILHTNDIHGHIVPRRVLGWDEEAGGAAVLAGCVNAVRRENRKKGGHTLLLDAGDFFVGSPEGDLSEGVAVVEVMNEIGYDALVLGNHDWDGGVANVIDLASRAAFPFLGANVIDLETGTNPPFVLPHLVVECGPLRVGVIGAALGEETPQEAPGGGRIVCGKPWRHVRASVEALRSEGVECIVLLSHLGLWADKRIARDVEGIDVIIGGHHHLKMDEPFRSPAGGTLICQAGSYGRHLGRLDLRVDPRSGAVEDYSYELIPLTEGRCPPDRAVAAVVEKWRRATGERFDEVVGRSDADFRKDVDGVRILGEMIADGMREATGAHISFNQRHGIRGALPGGTVTYRDVYAVLPFDDTLWTVTLTGRQVRDVLERTLSFRRQDNLRFSGLAVEYDPAAPRGERLVAAMCGEDELRDGESYLVAVNTYLVHWGFISELVAEGSDLRDTGLMLRDMFSDYIRAHSPLSPETFLPTRLVAVEGAAALR
ncbi:MAG: bifunctional UDP-sugar hydrolase/5'-nucleotidase [bacterium]|nr:bifunctional UDP-sugar hydrolase/5'-nucleotidase [bacterium]